MPAEAGCWHSRVVCAPAALAHRRTALVFVIHINGVAEKPSVFSLTSAFGVRKMKTPQALLPSLTHGHPPRGPAPLGGTVAPSCPVVFLQAFRLPVRSVIKCVKPPRQQRTAPQNNPLYILVFRPNCGTVADQSPG